jgi:hypothetical protein
VRCCYAAPRPLIEEALGLSIQRAFEKSKEDRVSRRGPPVEEEPAWE